MAWGNAGSTRHLAEVEQLLRELPPLRRVARRTGLDGLGQLLLAAAHVALRRGMEGQKAARAERVEARHALREVGLGGGRRGAARARDQPQPFHGACSDNALPAAILLI